MSLKVTFKFIDILAIVFKTFLLHYFRNQSLIINLLKSYSYGRLVNII